MGHATSGGVYSSLRQRLDRHAIGMPESETAIRILKILYRPEDAELAIGLPLRFQSLSRLSRSLRIPEPELERRLDNMADRGLVFDVEREGKRYFMLAPTIVGLFEFSMMRVRTDIDQKELARLLHEYLEGDPTFGRQAFAGETQIGRALVHETALPAGDHAEVLDWERATSVVHEAGAWAVGMCYCRHVRGHLGSACDGPVDVCMSLGMAAGFVARHGQARAIGEREALDILAMTRERGMVHIGDNVQKRLTFICSCCGCCCEMLRAINTLHMPGAVVSSAWAPAAAPAACKGCGRCARACPIGAIRLEGQGAGKDLIATVDESLCIGCGVCVPRCRKGALAMRPRARRVHVPETTARRVALMALERGKLQDLLIGSDAPIPARALSTVLRTVADLPPVKRRIASSQLRSRFVDAVMSGMKSTPMRWMSKL